MDTESTQRSLRGVVVADGIRLDAPLNLPQGTPVTVDVHVAGASQGNDDDVPIHSLTAEQLHEYALKHPAPQSWWDSTDNPFEPETPTADDDGTPKRDDVEDSGKHVPRDVLNRILQRIAEIRGLGSGG